MRSFRTSTIASSPSLTSSSSPSSSLYSPVITSLLSDILGEFTRYICLSLELKTDNASSLSFPSGCPVYVASGSAQGCAIGASYRAAVS